MGFEATLWERIRWGRRRSSWSGSRSGCSPPCSSTCQCRWCPALQTCHNLGQSLSSYMGFVLETTNAKRLVINQRHFHSWMTHQFLQIFCSWKKALWQHLPWISEDEEITKWSHLQIIEWHLCNNSPSPRSMTLCQYICKYRSAKPDLHCLEFTNIPPKINTLRVGFNVFIPARLHWALGVAGQLV